MFGPKKAITFKNVCRSFALLAFFTSVSAWAVTSNEYYQAGLGLYNSKDYDKAILYFGAAIKLDPANVAAYQGRGNCYYVKADYTDALQDYKQVQRLRPSPQIDQFVNNVQAKIGGASAIAAPSAAAASGDEYQQLFQKGRTEFNAKQYSAAIQDFEKALQKNHSEFVLYYYMGLTYKLLGDTKNAVVALGLANQKKPTSQIASYVKSLRAKLSQEDRDWADEQLSASASGKELNLHTRPPNETDFALRLEPGLVFPNLADFNTEGNNGVTYALSQNGTASYNASIPNLSAFLGVEPVVNLGQDLELGFLIAAIPVGTFTEQYSQGPSTTNNSFGITAYELGLNLRWLIGEGPVKFFIAAGPLLTPIYVAYNQSYYTSPTSSDYIQTGNFISWGFGGQAQLGIDFHIDNSISFGPMLTLQAVSANNFSGTLTDNSNNVNTTATLYTLPNGQWPSVVPVTAGNTAPSGAALTNIDLSGIVPSFHLSMFF